MRHPGSPTRTAAMHVAIAVLLSLVVGACGATVSDDSSTPSPAPRSTPRVEGPIPDELRVEGLFADPRPSAPDRTASLGPRPRSPFPPHDGRTVTLYDIQRSEVVEFGPGGTGLFSSDGRYLVWTQISRNSGVPPELRRWDLELETANDLGPAGAVLNLEGEGAVRVAGWGGDGEFIVDLRTGARLAAEPRSGSTPGYQLTQHRLDGVSVTRYTLWDGGTPVLRLDALQTVVASSSKLATLIPAGDEQANIFLIDIRSRSAEFVATTEVEGPGAIPIAASPNHVVWTPNYCSPVPGLTRIYDRATGQITELADSTLWVAGFTSSGRLIDGAFGGEAIIDPATLSWDAILPPSDGDTVWSPDFRYATRGITLGTRSTCPR